MSSDALQAVPLCLLQRTLQHATFWALKDLTRERCSSTCVCGDKQNQPILMAPCLIEAQEQHAMSTKTLNLKVPGGHRHAQPMGVYLWGSSRLSHDKHMHEFSPCDHLPTQPRSSTALQRFHFAVLLLHRPDDEVPAPRVPSPWSSCTCSGWCADLCLSLGCASQRGTSAPYFHSSLCSTPPCCMLHSPGT